jgi:hypothetical protein
MNFMAERSNLLKSYCQKDARLDQLGRAPDSHRDIGVRISLAVVYSLLHFIGAIRGKRGRAVSCLETMCSEIRFALRVRKPSRWLLVARSITPVSSEASNKYRGPIEVMLLRAINRETFPSETDQSPSTL